MKKSKIPLDFASNKTEILFIENISSNTVIAEVVVVCLEVFILKLYAVSKVDKNKTSCIEKRKNATIKGQAGVMNRNQTISKPSN